MFPEISTSDECKARDWCFQHIIDCHWEFSGDEQRAHAIGRNQFTYIITPSYKGNDIYQAIVKCNFCGESFEFAHMLKE